MSERNGSSTPGPGTAEIPVVRPAAPESVPVPPAPEETGTPGDGDLVPGMQATAPVSGRPPVRGARRGPLTVMGPWAPVAGGLLGLLLGLIVVLLLAGSAESFEDRLALAFTMLGLGVLGTAGILLAEEVRVLRQRARDVAVRPAWVEATAGLLNGLTPARLLLLVSAFVLFLAAFVGRG
jgi:hypothetical protein